MIGAEKMAEFMARAMIKAIPVAVGAVGAWIAANYTFLHQTFCTAQGVI